MVKWVCVQCAGMGQREYVKGFPETCTRCEGTGEVE